MADPLTLATVAKGGGLALKVGAFLKERVQERLKERQDEAFRMLLDGVANAVDHGDDASKAEAVEALLATNTATDTLTDAFRAMMDVIDDAAMPYIAKLYGEYTVNTRPRDRFFRGVSGFLRGASRDDIEALRGLLRAIAPFLVGTGGLDTTKILLGKGQLHEHDGNIRLSAWPGGSGPKGVADGSDGVDRTKFPAPSGYEVVVQELKNRHFAREPQGFTDAFTGNYVVVFEKEHMADLKRLITLFGP